MQWCEQVEKSGCGIACLAILCELSYARVVEMAPHLCGAKCGVDWEPMVEFLAEQGYAVQPLSVYDMTGELRKPWPPRPWSDRHIAMVWQTKADWLKDANVAASNNAHYCVIDSKGVVYDPAKPEHDKKRRLRDFYKVAFVAAVISTG